MSDHVKMLKRWINGCREGEEYRVAEAIHALLEENEQAEKCRHGWRGRSPEKGERIQTPCPACGLKSLFIGTGGHLTCSSVPGGSMKGCPSPIVQETWSSQQACIDATVALLTPPPEGANDLIWWNSETGGDGPPWLLPKLLKTLRGEKPNGTTNQK